MALTGKSTNVSSGELKAEMGTSAGGNPGTHLEAASVSSATHRFCWVSDMS